MHLLLAAVMVVELIGPAAGSAQTPSDRRQALTHYRLGRTFLAAEAWADAEKQFLQALDLDPRLSLAHHGLGKAYMGMKRYQSAVTAFSECRDSFRAEAGRAMTDQMARQQRRQELLFELRQELQRLQSATVSATGPGGTPTVPPSLTLRRLQDEVFEMERLLQSGGSVSPDLQVPAFVYLALGSAYFRAEQIADAEREYLNAVKVNPKYGEAHNNLAVVYMLTGRLDEAEAEVRRAEKAGFRVSSKFKDELKAAKKDIR